RAADLRVRVEAVDAGAEDQLALVGLADIDMDLARHDDAIQHRLDRLGDHGLQRVALDRQAEARHAGQHAGMAGDHHADLLGADGAARRLDADYLAAFDLEAGHFAILDDVDSARIGGAGEAPGDRVMAGDAAAALQTGAEDGVARIGRAIGERAIGRDLLAGQDLAVDAVQLDRIDAAA